MCGRIERPIFAAKIFVKDFIVDFFATCMFAQDYSTACVRVLLLDDV